MNIFLSPVPAKPERVGIYLPSLVSNHIYILPRINYRYKQHCVRIEEIEMTLNIQWKSIQDRFVAEILFSGRRLLVMKTIHEIRTSFECQHLNVFGRNHKHLHLILGFDETFCLKHQKSRDWTRAQTGLCVCSFATIFFGGSWYPLDNIQLFLCVFTSVFALWKPDSAFQSD